MSDNDFLVGIPLVCDAISSTVSFGGASPVTNLAVPFLQYLGDMPPAGEDEIENDAASSNAEAPNVDERSTPIVDESSVPALTDAFKVKVAGITINGVHHLNGRNYAGLREMVNALENTNESLDSKIPLTAQRVVWNAETRIATIRVINRENGDLASKDYEADKASEENKFLVIDGRNVVGVRELAELAGLADFRLEWHNIGDTQYVNLYEQKKVIFQNDGKTTTYVGFAANDNAYLAKADAETLVGTEYKLSEHEYIKGYFNVSEALKDKFEDKADFIMAHFHTTHSGFYANKSMQKEGAVTVIAQTPATQKTHPAQIIRVENYGLIRIFAEMAWPQLSDTDTTTVPVSSRQRMTDMVESGIKGISVHHIAMSQVPGVWSNAWSNRKDFHVNSQIVWKDKGKGAISDGQLFHVYSVKTGEGRANASGTGMIVDQDTRHVTGSNWTNNVSCTANLFADSNFGDYLAIIHETFHMLGVEDAYEYTLSKDNMIKPRASRTLVPNNSMMHSNQKITNVDIRMVFDAKEKNNWRLFADYESLFEIVTDTDFIDWQDGRAPGVINNINQGLMMTSASRAMTSYNKEREYLMRTDRVLR